MSESKQPLVFFVDDSATDRTRGLGLITRSHPDWMVVGFSRAQEALDEICQRRPTVVVTDLVMPEMDGRQLLQQISEDYPGIPVILITAQGDDQIAAECVVMGAANYVPKRRLTEQLIPALKDVITAEKEATATRRVLRSVISNRCHFEIPCDLDQIRSLVNFVNSRLQAVNLLELSRIHRVTVAIREALLNAYFHGSLQVNEDPLQYDRTDYISIATERRAAISLNRKIRLTMSLLPDEITFTIADDGPGFDQSCLTELSGPPSAALSKGNGVRLMRSSVTSVSWNDAGNEVTLSSVVGQA